jgi:histidine triad (HIT) family protein
MGSIFAKIAIGEIPSYKITETENCFAFLDINPLAKGHTLVIPKQEIDNLFDLDDKLYADLCLLAKKIAKAIAKTIPCEKIGVAVIGLEVRHAHIHLIPIYGVHDIDFIRPKLKLSENEFTAIATAITANLQD